MSASPKKTWLIVGASRGIGHEFVRQLLVRGEKVYATVRNPSAEHQSSFWTGHEGVDPPCTVFSCDVLNEQSLLNLALNIKAQGARIDHVVINAGVLKYPNRASEVSYEDFAFHLHSNTIGPIICAQKLLSSGIGIGAITFISSDSGSAQQFRKFEDGFAAYAASKAALNQMARHLAAELERKGTKTTVLLLHPGEVMTDMAKIEVEWDMGDQLTPEESVSGCLKTIESKSQIDSGTFWTWENKVSEPG
ncbi:NAD(P)-binding protein [Hortaea werneckii]|nr:NAD(P)-binding protein [Hortaea werneckii]KAI6870548.1 NAD(P)-binding protein [Hortaea werneckii]KAI7110937.1 NAD(P)-binding protein [Hortaea werneckii]KAI7354998.1 NAD(P)-binding protein [Hortaea werneckii]KAI7552253.1 NAD(P)-binding protein [Hortaea werneckii]